LANAEQRYGFKFDDEWQWSSQENDRHWQQVGQVAQGIVWAHPVDAVLTHLAATPQVWWGPLGDSGGYPYEYRGWYAYTMGREWPWFEKSVEELETLIATRAPVERLGDWAIEADKPAATFWLGWHLLFYLGLLCLALGIWALRRQRAILLPLLTV